MGDCFPGRHPRCGPRRSGCLAGQRTNDASGKERCNSPKSNRASHNSPLRLKNGQSSHIKDWNVHGAVPRITSAAASQSHRRVLARAGAATGDHRSDHLSGSASRSKDATFEKGDLQPARAYTLRSLTSPTDSPALASCVERAARSPWLVTATATTASAPGSAWRARHGMTRHTTRELIALANRPICCDDQDVVACPTGQAAACCRPCHPERFMWRAPGCSGRGSPVWLQRARLRRGPSRPGMSCRAAGPPLQASPGE